VLLNWSIDISNDTAKMVYVRESQIVYRFYLTSPTCFGFVGHI